MKSLVRVNILKYQENWLPRITTNHDTIFKYFRSDLIWIYGINKTIWFWPWDYFLLKFQLVIEALAWLFSQIKILIRIPCSNFNMKNNSTKVPTRILQFEKMIKLKQPFFFGAVSERSMGCSRVWRIQWFFRSGSERSRFLPLRRSEKKRLIIVDI